MIFLKCDDHTSWSRNFQLSHLLTQLSLVIEDISCCYSIHSLKGYDIRRMNGLPSEDTEDKALGSLNTLFEAENEPKISYVLSDWLARKVNNVILDSVIAGSPSYFSYCRLLVVLLELILFSRT